MRLHELLRGCLAACSFLLGLLIPAGAWGFDTAWHFHATAGAAAQANFNKNATQLLILGNFGPDFFGPLYDYAAQGLPGRLELHTPWLRELLSLREPGNPEARKVRNAAIFLHFDDLHGALDSNARFDTLFTSLLWNTRNSVVRIHQSQTLSAREKKILILLTLGASLHMVQDFYSHSNWTHLVGEAPRDNRMDTGLMLGRRHTFTWFEALTAAGSAQQLRFTVECGTYPDPDPKSALLTSEGVPKTHALMNHDNSQLGGNARNLRYHAGGPSSAVQSARLHQLIAVRTAWRASLEWIQKVEQDPAARAALASAREGPEVEFVESEVKGLMMLSCGVRHWDGAEGVLPGGTRCQSMDWKTALVINSGAVTTLSPGLPTARRELWAAFVQHDVLEHLVGGFGDLDTGRYRFVAPGALTPHERTHIPASAPPGKSP